MNTTFVRAQSNAAGPPPWVRYVAALGPAVLPAVLLVALLAACGDATRTSTPGGAVDRAGRPAADLSVPTAPAPAEKVTGLGLVIDQGDGVQLCLGPVAESYPPQCDGLPLARWDWSTRDDFEKAGGVRFGSYAVTGTFDGTSLTSTDEPVSAALYDPAPDPAVARTTSTRCDEPADGWSIVNRAKATAQALERAEQTATGLAGYVTQWRDLAGGQQILGSETGIGGTEPGLDPGPGEGAAGELKLILNVQVTGDVVTASKLMRTVWGGALCVSNPQHDQGELDGIVAELSGQPGVLSVTPQADRVVVSVLFDDGTVQRYLDDFYGADTVIVTPSLRPVE
ncbi:MAG: hypothetical protein ACRCYU_12735 [Nocardioides sp.]